MNRATAIAIVLLGLGAVATGWWQYRTADHTRKAGPAAPEGRRTAYTMAQVTVVQMTLEGTPDYRLKAETLTNYAGDGHSELDQPRLTVHRPQGPPWQLASDRGRVSADAEQVHLLGRVFIERPGSPVNRPLQAVTRDLLVLPAKSYGETDAPAQMHSEGLYTEGVGLRAELDADRLVLLSQVTSRHETPR